MKSVRETVTELCNKTDYEIYFDMLNRDISAHHLTKEKKDEIIKKSMETAVQCYNEVVSKFGELNNPAEYAIRLHIPINYVNEKPNKYYSYVGIFTEKNQTITLNSETIAFIKQLINQFGIADLVDPNQIKSTVTAHELFHYFEFIHPELYTNQKILDAKILGIFKTKSSLLAAGEVAAMHFAKLLTKLHYTPLVYNKIFALGKKQLL